MFIYGNIPCFKMVLLCSMVEETVLPKDCVFNIISFFIQSHLRSPNLFLLIPAVIKSRGNKLNCAELSLKLVVMKCRRLLVVIIV